MCSELLQRTRTCDRDFLELNTCAGTDTTMREPFIKHADIRNFAESRVNLPSESARRYRGQVNTLRERLAKHIADNPGFGLVKMLHAGSVAKGTALRTINDLDAAVYVRKDQTPGEEKDLVPWMADRLREAYPEKDPSDVTTDSPHCAKIHFRGSDLDVDVVPVLYEGDENDYGYLVDKFTGARLLTSVPRHLEFIRKRKAANQTHFAQVVRLIKWWANQRKAENSAFKCKSFLQELLAAHLADRGTELKDYTQALEEFFTYVVKTGLEERVAFTDYYPKSSLQGPTGAAIEVFDPVNPENNVTDKYMWGDREALVEAAEEAADAIREAFYATTKGRAVESWQTILGPSFRG